MSAIEAERRRLREEEEKLKPERERIRLQKEEQVRIYTERSDQERRRRWAEEAVKERTLQQKMNQEADRLFDRVVDDLENNQKIREEVIHYIAKQPDGDVNLIEFQTPPCRIFSMIVRDNHFITSLAGGHPAWEMDYLEYNLLANAVQRKTYDHKFVHPDLKGWGVRAVGCTSRWFTSWYQPLVKIVAYPLPWYRRLFRR